MAKRPSMRSAVASSASRWTLPPSVERRLESMVALANSVLAVIRSRFPSYIRAVYFDPEAGKKANYLA